MGDEMNAQHSRIKSDSKLAQSKVENQKLDDLKSSEKKKEKLETRMAEEKRKFEKKKKEQKRAAATARENHEKAVNGRENRNCHKFCNLYRVATDSTSTPERA